MKNQLLSRPRLGSVTRALMRIARIIRTRNVYGYNSVCERIIRYLLNNRERRKNHSEEGRCTQIERM
jgi:hypothetical protein